MGEFILAAIWASDSMKRISCLNKKYYMTKLNLSTLMEDLLWPSEVKLKVKFTLEQATMAQRWSRVIALLFL